MYFVESIQSRRRKGQTVESPDSMKQDDTVAVLAADVDYM